MSVGTEQIHMSADAALQNAAGIAPNFGGVCKLQEIETAVRNAIFLGVSIDVIEKTVAAAIWGAQREMEEDANPGLDPGNVHSPG
jgi:hypothetical protein